MRLYKFKFLFLNISMLVFQSTFGSDLKIRTFITVVDRRAVLKKTYLECEELIAKESLVRQLVASRYIVAPECVAIETGRSVITGSLETGFNLVSAEYTATIKN